MDISWIFFDVGSTLVDEDEAHRLRYLKVADDIRASCGREIGYDKFLELMYEAGRLKAKSPFYYVLKNFGIDVQIPYRDEGEKLYPDAIVALDGLSRHFRLGVIANQPPMLEKKLERFGLLKYFSAVFGSQDVELHKPDPRFYLHALNETGCPAERAVMVGDRLDNDIEPAKKLGMKTIRILRGFYRLAPVEHECERPDFTVDGLDEIFNILIENKS